MPPVCQHRQPRPRRARLRRRAFRAGDRPPRPVNAEGDGMSSIRDINLVATEGDGATAPWVCACHAATGMRQVLGSARCAERLQAAGRRAAEDTGMSGCWAGSRARTGRAVSRTGRPDRNQPAGRSGRDRERDRSRGLGPRISVPEPGPRRSRDPRRDGNREHGRVRDRRAGGRRRMRHGCHPIRPGLSSRRRLPCWRRSRPARSWP